ncbi:cytochrome P450 [Streptomyces sp. NPDC007264]|uniref:cytochrome P450 n=1 Tax=Streptomyces sp. NPDC007264 TaxID=3364777 RepID=UPI0036DB672F
MGKGSVAEAGDRFDRVRRTAKVVKVQEPDRWYWMVLDHDLIRDCLQKPQVFSSCVLSPLTPEPPYKMIPIQLDPPEHTPWRQMLARFFSPKRMSEMRPDLEARCRKLIAAIAAKGECDVLEDFALPFTTSVFLDLMGLPVEELPNFLVWENQIIAPDENGQCDPARQEAGALSAMRYFAQEIPRRRADPSPTPGLLTDMLDWEFDGQKPSDEALVNCSLLLFMAGLDTVASSLSYMLYHLATQPKDREHVARLVVNGEPTEDVVEELLRYYAVAEIGRKVTQDYELDGHQLREGDLILFPLVSANRDHTFISDGEKVSFDRPDAAPHLTFGAGPHRCLGSHLARIELNVALTEWHRALADYRVKDGAEVTAYYANVHGLLGLPVEVRPSNSL